MRAPIVPFVRLHRSSKKCQIFEFTVMKSNAICCCCHRYIASNWFEISFESNIMQKRCSLIFNWMLENIRRVNEFEVPLIRETSCNRIYLYPSIAQLKCNDFATQTLFNLLSWKCGCLYLFAILWKKLLQFLWLSFVGASQNPINNMERACKMSRMEKKPQQNSVYLFGLSLKIM